MSNAGNPLAGPQSAPPAREVGIAFGAIVLAMLPAVLDQTILATALPTIARDLGRVTDLSWVVTAYVVAAAATTPVWGKLGDRHGRKLMLEVALVGFVAASTACAAAESIPLLIAFRAVQGAAAGGLMSLAMACVGDLVSPRERGRYQGYIAGTFAVATVVGPLLGGVIVDHTTWRWVFIVNLPLGVLALAGLHSRLPAAKPASASTPLDVVGAVLLAAATCALMLACIWGGDRYAWSSPVIASLAVALVVLSAGLVARERRAADPIVPLHVLLAPGVALASTAMFLTTACLFSVTVFAPLLLQVTTGATATESGLLLVPAMAGITISTTISGRLMTRTGRYKRFPLAGLALMSIASIVLAVVADDGSRLRIGIGLAIFGLGFGMVTQILIVAVQNVVEKRDLGVATATTGFFRALGGAIGAAALGAVFTARAGTGQPAQIAAAIQRVFYVAAPIAAAALIAVALLREVPLEGPDPGNNPAAPAARASSRS